MTEINALTPDTIADMRAQVSTAADLAVDAIIAEVPEYANALSGPMGAQIRSAVQLALTAFMGLVEKSGSGRPGAATAPAREYAYQLGRGEARSGRTVDALLAAFRIGTRVCWQELASAAVRHRVAADLLADFAGMVFAYIDELSASSVAGHTDELAASGRIRERLLDRMVHLLMTEAPADPVRAAALAARWEPPATLTAVVAPRAAVRAAFERLPAHTLESMEDLPGLGGRALLLAPDLTPRRRGTLARVLVRDQVVIGPTRPWLEVRRSVDRALRAIAEGLVPDGGDTEEHLPELVLGADPVALADLRRRALAPLASLRPSTAEKLTETLRVWLLHQGRRDDVAAALFVHPQTVRYRMGQLREVYGDRLDDPRTVLELTVALGRDTLT